MTAVASPVHLRDLRLSVGSATVILSVLFFAPVSVEAKVVTVGNGNPVFFRQVQDALAALQECFALNELYYDVTDPNGKSIYVRQSSARFNETNPSNDTAAVDGTGANSVVIDWNPNLTSPFSDGVLRDPAAELVHELLHAS